MKIDSIKNEQLWDQMRYLYGGINVTQLAKDLGHYPREVTEDPIREVRLADYKPVDQSLVRRWLTGERPVPAWAERGIAHLLGQRLYDIAFFMSYKGYGEAMGMDAEYLQHLRGLNGSPWARPELALFETREKAAKAAAGEVKA